MRSQQIDKYLKLDIIIRVWGVILSTPMMVASDKMVGMTLSPATIQILSMVTSIICMFSVLVESLPIPLRIWIPIIFDVVAIAITPIVFTNPMLYLILQMIIDAFFMLLYGARGRIMQEKLKGEYDTSKHSSRLTFWGSLTGVIVGVIMVGVYKFTPATPIMVIMWVNILSVIIIGLIWRQNLLFKELM